MSYPPFDGRRPVHRRRRGYAADRLSVRGAETLKQPARLVNARNQLFSSPPLVSEALLKEPPPSSGPPHCLLPVSVDFPFRGRGRKVRRHRYFYRIARATVRSALEERNLLTGAGLSTEKLFFLSGTLSDVSRAPDRPLFAAFRSRSAFPHRSRTPPAVKPYAAPRRSTSRLGRFAETLKILHISPF